MPHAYLGSDDRQYLQYADAATGRTLEVVPGGTYEMRPFEPGLPVPPADGRWGPASPPPPPARTDLTPKSATPASEPGDPEPESTPQTSALPALPGTGDGDQPATDTPEE